MPPQQTIKLPPEKIELVQSRAIIDQATVDEYAQEMRDGAHFPAIEATFDGESYWCWDGCHRVLAARQARVEPYMLVRLTDGDRRKAVLLAAGANATHGLRRSNADKRRAVTWLLEDPEWSKWSDREIARRCKVSHTFVANLRGQLSGNGLQIERKARRGDSTYTIDTEQIGRSRTNDRPQHDPAAYEGAIRVTLDGHWLDKYLAGRWSPHIARARSGFPQSCPTGHADPVNGANCDGCPHYFHTIRGTWLCAHLYYQEEPGDHFCRKCGEELSPYAQAHGWAYCHGDRCDRESEDAPAPPPVKPCARCDDPAAPGGLFCGGDRCRRQKPIAPEHPTDDEPVSVAEMFADGSPHDPTNEDAARQRRQQAHELYLSAVSDLAQALRDGQDPAWYTLTHLVADLAGHSARITGGPDQWSTERASRYLAQAIIDARCMAIDQFHWTHPEALASYRNYLEGALARTNIQLAETTAEVVEQP